MEYRTFQSAPGIAPSLLGYGCMRFPTQEDGSIDRTKAEALIHRAMEAGITYYDTAWPYHRQESEPFMGKVLSQYPRDSYYLATKLPTWEIKSRQQARERVLEQLERLNMDHIDFYLLHNLNKRSWDRMVREGVLEELEALREEGKLRYLGFSFHDSFELFSRILRFHKWDLCQIQLNYMDVNYQAGLQGLALAEKLGIPVVVMEPVKGGSLATLPEDVTQPMRRLDPEASPASWALRWVGSQPNVKVILSGMGTMEQLEDNLHTFDHFRPLSQEERAAVAETAGMLRQRLKNGCTGCGYCMPCPAGVDIPTAFQMWNNRSVYRNQMLSLRSWKNLAAANLPQLCVGCGACETKCPQGISIRDHLSQIPGDMDAFTGLNRAEEDGKA